MTWFSGNGGEYLGFNGSVEPWNAARNAFEHRDYRFLTVAIRDELDNRVDVPYRFPRCENHPFGPENSLRPSSDEQIHGNDSAGLAYRFANHYNNSMSYLLADMMDGYCDVLEDGWTEP